MLEMDIDADFERIGYFGPYQKFIWFTVMMYSALPAVSSVLYLMFANILPEWTCDPPNMGSAPPFGRDCDLLANCTALGLNVTMRTQFDSAVSYFGLHCNRGRYVFFEFMEVTGRLVGDIFGGPLVDYCGRKWTVFGSYTLLIITGYASGLAKSESFFSAFRFLSGASQRVSQTSVNTYTFELIDAKHRPLVRTFGGWSMFAMVFGLIAYLCGDWRKLTLVTNSLSLPFLFIVLFCAVESPRWLASKKKYEKAQAIMDKMGKYNRAPPRTVAADEASPDQNAPLVARQSTKITKNYRIWHLVLSRRLCVYTFVMAYMLFTVGLIKNGVLFSLKLLIGNKYANFILQAAVTQVVMAILMFADWKFEKIGRKAICLGAAAIFEILMWVIVFATLAINLVGQTVVQTVTQYCALFSLAGLHSLNGFLNVIVTEIYPTSLRGTAFGLCNCFFTIGGIASSYIANYLNDFWPALSYAVFAVCGLFSILLFVVFIPETKYATLDEKLATGRLSTMTKKETNT